MTDLINKVDELIKTNRDSIQAIVNKYSAVLQDNKPEREIPYLAYIIDICVKHINENHKDVPKDWKAWSVVLVRNLFFKKKIKNEDEIIKTIDDFIVFWKSEFETYCKEIIAATEYDRDRGFVFSFEQKNR